MRLIAALGSAGILMILLLATIVGCLLFPYTVETWSTFLGKPLFVTWYIGLFVTVVMTWFIWGKFPGFVMGAALITWMCELIGVFS